MPDLLRIATRKSALALWQARHVAALLETQHPGLGVELLPLSTRGDRELDTPLAMIGGKGLFLKELERALLDGNAHIAVHSMKDVPSEMTHGLSIAAVLERANPSDAWLSADDLEMDALPEGAVVGTSSLRRQSQILARRPDLRVESLRGNVNTRLNKLESGEFDAIILATAGLQRLGLEKHITAMLPPRGWIPAPSQGVIGIQCKSEDQATQALLKPLDHAATRQTSSAERALAQRLGGSCQLPIGAYAELDGDGVLALRALVGSADGRTILRGKAAASSDSPETVAQAVAQILLEQGADAVIREELGRAKQ